MKKNILGRKKEEGRLMIWIMFIDCVYMEEKRMNVCIYPLANHYRATGGLPTGGHSTGGGGPSSVGLGLGVLNCVYGCICMLGGCWGFR